MKEIELVKEILNYSTVYIYGAGECATTLSYLLDKLNKLDRIKEYIVSKEIETKKLFGKQINTYADIKNLLTREDLVIVAVSEEKWKDIREILCDCSAKIMWILDADMRYYRSYVRNGNPEMLRLMQEETLHKITLYNSIKTAKWIESKDFEPGGVAVSSKYLFLLYKILQSRKFKSFLDIGLGQTSKLIAQYVKNDEQAKCTVVEADEAWMKFFLQSNNIISKNMDIVLCKYVMENYNDAMVRKYEDFENALSNHKFDYISIDAPIGEGMTTYSRVDILNILPQCLCDSWIIMMDDTNRAPERNTLELIKKKLTKYNISYICKEFYCFEKDFTIITSEDNVFFTSI